MVLKLKRKWKDMKLIDKDKVDEILEYTPEYDCVYRDGIIAVLHVLKKRLDTLELKEIDLDDEHYDRQRENLRKD